MPVQPLLLMFMLLGSSALTSSAADYDWSTDRVLVRFKPNIMSVQAVDRLGVQLRRSVGNGGTRVYTITDGTPVHQKVAQLRSLPGVAYAEPDYKVRVSLDPSDARFSEQWGLPRISAPRAWDISTGSPQVKVCIVDSGIDLSHPDLAGRVVKGFNLVPKNQTAEEPVAPVPGSDDYYDYDDKLGHGTMVAGVLAAMGNNGLGVAGVAWNIQLVICKFIWDVGTGYVSDAMTCQQLCREEGAMITSNSYGGIPFSQALYDEVQRAGEAGQLFVTATANNAVDLDVEPQYPGALNLPNVISTASTGPDDSLSPFSNYGRNSTNLAAPGQDILTTIRGGGYGTASGTSLSTPLVAATAGLVQSVARAVGRNFTYEEIKSLVLRGVDRVPALVGKVRGGGRLNVFNSVKLARAAMRKVTPDLTRSNPLGYYTIWQTVYTTAPTCKAWAAQSQPAFIQAAAALSGLPPSSFGISCQPAGGGRKRVSLKAVTRALRLTRARQLVASMNAGVLDGSFERLVQQHDPHAHPLAGAAGYCVVGHMTCPPPVPLRS